MVFDFDLNVPFKPFEQLMGVMPELSCSLLPIPYRVSSNTIEQKTESSLVFLLGPHDQLRVTHQGLLS